MRTPSPSCRIRAGHLPESRDRGERDPAGRRRLLAECLLERLEEDRVARVLRDASSAEKWQVREVEVTHAPAEERRVEGQHDRRTAAPLSPRDKTRHEVVRGAPVELEPVGRIAHRSCRLLHGARRLVGEHEWDAFGGGSACSGQVGVPVSEFQHADRAEVEGAREWRSKNLDSCVAHGDVSEHRGAMRQHSKAALLALTVSSVPAPPAK